MIEITHEDLYGYDSTLSCLTLLKIFHEAGIDVKKRARHFSLHNQYSYGGYISTDIFELANLLFPHLFDVETHGITCTVLSFDEISSVIRDIIENLDMPKDFNKEEHIALGENGGRFFTFVYEGPPGTFDFIDWSALEKASNPFHFNKDYRNANMTFLRDYYSDGKESKRTTLHKIDEFADDYLIVYYFATHDRSRFVLYFDADICGEVNLTFTGLMLAELRRQFIQYAEEKK